MSKNMNLLMENWRKFVNEAKTAVAPDAATAQQLDNIIKMPYEQFVTQFAKVAADPKVQAVLKYGLEDGQPNDEKVKITKMNANVSALKPTQNEIDINKSLGFPIKSTGALIKILKGGPQEPGGPIVTAAGGTIILDGHHRWSQVFCINPNAQISAIDLNIQGANAETYLKVLQMAIASDVQKVPTQSVDSVNLLDPSLSRQQLVSFLLKMSPKEVLIECANSNSEVSKLIKQVIGSVTTTTDQAVNEDAPAMAIKRGQGSGPVQNGANKLAQLIYNNILKMRANNQPLDPAPKRGFMPQTDTATNWLTKASSGEINFKDTAKLAAAATVPSVQKESLKKIVRQVIRENLKRK